MSCPRVEPEPRASFSARRGRQDRQAPPTGAGIWEAGRRVDGNGASPRLCSSCSPPRESHGGAGDRASRGSTASWGRPGPSGGRDAPRPTGPQPGKRHPPGPVGEARDVTGAGSSACARPPPRGCHLRRVASPRGSRRTRGAGTFPRERARPPPGPTGPADPRPPAPGHRRVRRTESVRRVPGIELVAECRLREEGQRVGPLLALVGGSAADQSPTFVVLSRAPLVSVLARGVSPARELRARLPATAGLGRPPCRLRPGTRARPGSCAGVPPLASAFRSTRRHPRRSLHVRRRAGPPHVEQALLGLRCRDPGQGPDLGVRQLAPRRGLRQRGSVPRARATRTRSRAAPRSRLAPLEPVGAGGNPGSSPRGRRTRGSASSRRAVAASRWAESSAISSPSRSTSARSGSMGCEGCNGAGPIRSVCAHGRVSLLAGTTLHLGFGGPRPRREAAWAARAMIFRPRGRDRGPRVERGSLGRHFTAALEARLASRGNVSRPKWRLDTDSIL